MITFACVRTGDAYGKEYVTRLRNMVGRYCPVPHRFICVTDKPFDHAGIDMIDVSSLGLPKWWAKMALLSPFLRGKGRCIYFDLDTVICGDLSPLIHLKTDFGVCANFTRRAGHKNWPCNYGSCVMTFRQGFGEEAYAQFNRDKHAIMKECGRFGDQLAIEKLVPNATLLQDVLPEGFFLGKRSLSAKRDPRASVIVFGGPNKPHNTQHKWVRELWN